MRNAPAAKGEGLEICGVSAGYPRRPVLRSLTLAPMPRGSVTAIVGPNGAGKSTLLRAIAGLLPATGSARLGPLDLLSMQSRRRAKWLGFMPQTIPVGADLTVLETVVSALRAGDFCASHAAMAARAVAVLEQLGLLPLALRPLNELSGGQRQLASLAQAIVGEPPVLLLDEPVSALDLRRQIQFIGVVRRIAAAGAIVLMVLHDLNFAARWADRLVVLDQGKLDSEGAPAAVATPAMLERVYGVAARVEHCSHGLLQIMIDDIVGGAPVSNSGIDPASRAD